MFRRVSIRTNIFTNILLIVTVVAGTLLWLEYTYLTGMAAEATERRFKDAAEKITIRLKEEDKLAKTLLHQICFQPGIDENPHEDLPADILWRFTETLRLTPSVYALYLGYPDGDLYEVVNMKMDDSLRVRYDAPEGSRWMVIRIFQRDEERIRRFIFLDDALKELKRRDEKVDYVVNARPWYLQALETDHTVRGNPYLFSNLQEEGITYSRRVGRSQTVAALDFTLEKLRSILASRRFAQTAKIVMFDHNGTLIASSDATDRVDPLFLDLLRKKRIGVVEADDKEEDGRFAMVTSLSSELGKDSYLGFSVQKEEMLAPYLEEIFRALAAAFAALFLTVPLVYYTSGRIVRPIRALTAENRKIQARRYDEVRPVETNIIELKEFSDSFLAMTKSIRNHERALREMMESFIRLIADAIDAKSPYTGGHCKRVPVLARKLAEAAHRSTKGEFAGFSFENEEEFRIFEMGAWLHDCGKITTPEYVVDKATKLETIYNRIHEIRMRFEVLWRDLEIEHLRALAEGEDTEKSEERLRKEREKLREDFAFVARCNLGDPPLSDEDVARLKKIAAKKWIRHFDNRLGLSPAELERMTKSQSDLPVEEPLLADREDHRVERNGFDEDEYRKKGFRLEVPKYLFDRGELYNLSIRKGTLTKEERFKIEEHVIMTIRMLEQLPYPKGMEKIPEYAGTHHETLDGAGYPRRLEAKDLPIPSRIMAVADIFEALTASDRPYKRAKTLSEALDIMTRMVREGHLDREVFLLFLEEGIALEYAREYLEPRQRDLTDLSAFLQTLKNMDPQEREDG